MTASHASWTRRQVCHLRLAGVLLAFPGLACVAFGLQLHAAFVMLAGVRGVWLGWNRYELLGAVLLTLAVYAFEYSQRVPLVEKEPGEPSA